MSNFKLPYAGPDIQNYIFSMLIRFRSDNIAVVADINKMYRRVSLHSDDRFSHKIVWRGDTS